MKYLLNLVIFMFCYSAYGASCDYERTGDSYIIEIKESRNSVYFHSVSSGSFVDALAQCKNLAAYATKTNKKVFLRDEPADYGIFFKDFVSFDSLSNLNEIKFQHSHYSCEGIRVKYNQYHVDLTSSKGKIIYSHSVSGGSYYEALAQCKNISAQANLLKSNLTVLNPLLSEKIFFEDYVSLSNSDEDNIDLVFSGKNFTCKANELNYGYFNIDLSHGSKVGLYVGSGTLIYSHAVPSGSMADALAQCRNIAARATNNSLSIKLNTPPLEHGIFFDDFVSVLRD